MPVFSLIIDGDTLETAQQLFRTQTPLSNSLSSSKPNSNPCFRSEISQNSHTQSSMADHGGNGGNGDVVDRPMDEGATMEPEEEDRTTVEMTAGEGAVVGGGDNDRSDQQPAVENEAG